LCNHHGMKRLLPVLMGLVVLLLSSTEGWSADCQKFILNVWRCKISNI